MNPKCMVPGCESESRWRGICGKCYHQAKTLIKEGATTWDQLATLGLCVADDKKLLAAFIKLTKDTSK